MLFGCASINSIPSPKWLFCSLFIFCVLHLPSIPECLMVRSKRSIRVCLDSKDQIDAEIHLELCSFEFSPNPGTTANPVVWVPFCSEWHLSGFRLSWLANLTIHIVLCAPTWPPRFLTLHIIPLHLSFARSNSACIEAAVFPGHLFWTQRNSHTLQ